MIDEEQVIDRKPYKSGGSIVITASGVPILSKGKNVFLRRIEIDGTPFVIGASYDNVSRYEMENLPSEITLGDKEHIIHEHSAVTKSGAMSIIEDEIDELSDNERIKIQVISKE